MHLLKISNSDLFDPNNWEPDDHEHRIYADETLQTYAIVDYIDYLDLCLYKWSVHTRHYAPGVQRAQFYLRRAIHVPLAPEGPQYYCPVTQKQLRNRKRAQKNLFLHQEVMRRAGIEPPDDLHVIVDHIDRDTLNCRRNNLRWATHKHNSNNRSRHGRHPSRSTEV